MDFMTQIDDVVFESEVSVITSLCEYYTKQCEFIEHAHYQESITQFFQEGEKWDAFKNDIKAAKGNDGESLIKRILLFIPRILKACVTAIGRFFQKKDNDTMINDIKYLQKRVEDLEKENDKNKENIKTLAKHILNLHNQIESGRDVNDVRYDNLNKTLLSMYGEMKQLGLTKVDKTDNISQIRAVLILAGYVLFSFDLTAYKTFLEDFEKSLSKMDDINVESDDINFSDFSVTNINLEVENGQYSGHYIYNISDFEKYMTELKTLHEKVAKHCNKLIKKFETLGKSWKFRKNGDIKDTAMKNINEANKVLNKILVKINKTQQWYRQDENRIRQLINEERGSITNLTITDESVSNGPSVQDDSSKKK